MPTDDMRRIELLTAAHAHRGGALLDAIAAACAIITHADAGETASERRGVRALQLSDPLMAALPADELSSRLADHAAAWRADPAAAQAAALRALVPRVLAGLVRRGEDFDAAEDALQEALLEALRVWPEHPPRDPRAWLATVATRSPASMTGSAIGSSTETRRRRRR